MMKTPEFQNMDWGTVTPDVADPENEVAIHVMNVSLESSESIDRFQRFLATFRDSVKWEDVNEDVYPFMPGIEFFPILPDLKNKGGLGISIPSKFINAGSWDQLQLLYRLLKKQYKAEIYDLFSGQLTTEDNLVNLRDFFP